MIILRAHHRRIYDNFLLFLTVLCINACSRPRSRISVKSSIYYIYIIVNFLICIPYKHTSAHARITLIYRQWWRLQSEIIRNNIVTSSLQKLTRCCEILTSECDNGNSNNKYLRIHAIYNCIKYHSYPYYKIL
jgi:hypothetical protein